MFSLGNRRRAPATPPRPAAPVEPTAVQDLEERVDKALRQIHHHLTTQHLLFPDDRDQELCDALLDLRNILQPGSWVLPVRPSVPVIPGRSS